MKRDKIKSLIKKIIKEQLYGTGDSTTVDPDRMIKDKDGNITIKPDDQLFNYTQLGGADATWRVTGYRLNKNKERNPWVMLEPNPCPGSAFNPEQEELYAKNKMKRQRKDKERSKKI